MSRLTVRSFLALTAACLAMAAPSGAAAATVVNGDFEAGSLSGWQVYNSTPAGNWFAFSSSDLAPRNQEAKEFEGIEPFFPPTGNYAAYTEEEFPDTAILYQDVTLEPFFTHQLTMTLGYTSFKPIVAPNTLAVSPGLGGEANQQLRVDIVKPTAPIESLAPEDILVTPFANKAGDPEVLTPRTVGADLSALAGQTVRIRVANAVHEAEFNAMVDNVALLSTPPSNAISRGKLTLNRKKGTGRLAIRVPAPGTLVAVGKGKAKKVRRSSLVALKAGTVKLPLNPNSAGRKVLDSSGKLKTRIAVTFTPAGGTAATETYKVTLKKNLKAK